MPKDSQESKEKLMLIVSDAVSKDAALREEFRTGDKFRFIRDRLQSLKQQIEDAMVTIKVEEVGNKQVLAEDEELVYVYLFNAHGMDLQSWHKMLHPSVYYDHSVNRPIYGDQEQVETVIRNKTNRIQHGYLVFAVKKSNILSRGEAAKDATGISTLKIREGSFKPERFIQFWHNGQLYKLDEDGRIKKIISKPSA